MRRHKVLALNEDGSKRFKVTPFLARKLVDSGIAKIVSKDPFTIQVINDTAYEAYRDFLKTEKGEK